jgi:uncharacterized membrane protein YphA (DoxX/SURF4 family)
VPSQHELGSDGTRSVPTTLKGTGGVQPEGRHLAHRVLVVRLALVRVTLLAAMAAGLLLSPNLWLTGRAYPTVPVWDGLPDVPPSASRFVFGALLVLLIFGAVLHRARWPLLAFVTLAGGWSMWDQTRWQPWFYQYLAMLVTVGAARRDDPTALNICRLVVAATYVWSGLQKVNVTFASDTYPWVMEPLLGRLPEGLAAWAGEQGWVAAGVEFGLGVALLVPPLRVVAVPLLIGMHATLLYCLGPFGHDWNSVVWPWNVALPALDVMLFAGARGATLRQIVWPPGSPLARGVLLLFGIMPAFSFVGWWDPYLSASLYSGNTPRARITLSEVAADGLAPWVRENHLSGDEIDLPGWAMEELNVPGYPSRRVFRGVARRLGDPGDVRLVTEDRPHWRTGERDQIEEALSREP